MAVEKYQRIMSHWQVPKQIRSTSAAIHTAWKYQTWNVFNYIMLKACRFFVCALGRVQSECYGSIYHQDSTFARTQTQTHTHTHMYIGMAQFSNEASNRQQFGEISPFFPHLANLFPPHICPNEWQNYSYQVCRMLVIYFFYRLSWVIIMIFIHIA